MNRPGHLLLGFLAGETYAATTGNPRTMVVVAGVFAMGASAGPASPDMDQTEPWVEVRKRLPSSVDQVMNHRYLTHWWGWPILAYWWVAQLPPEASWATTALLVGWSSHLLGDAVFGELHLFPWGGPSFGLGLKTGGFIETGKAKVKKWLLWGKKKERQLLPFGPARLVFGLAIIGVLLGAPNLHDLARSIPS